MSHSEERKEKICLNCGAEVIGRYCHKCGQENIEPQQSVGHFIVHFFNDFTHFDGKFFKTIKLLLFRPGFLSEEYRLGKRAAYLDPAKMYIFTSAITFLLLFTIAPSLLTNKDITANNKSLIRKKDVGEKAIAVGSDLQQIGEENLNRDTAFSPATVAQYDSFQKALPPSERDGRFTRYMERRVLTAINKMEHSKNGDEAGEVILEKFFHSFPQLFFVSLPFFAGILYVLYIRRRKKYYFVSHAIFTIHFYCAVYIIGIVSLLLFLVPYLNTLIPFIMVLFPLIYLYIAMKRFYGQGLVKTFIKYIILNVLAFTITVMLFIFYLLYSLIAFADSI